MARKRFSRKQSPAKLPAAPTGRAGRPSSLLDTRIVYCGDCLDSLRKLPDACVNLWHRFPTGDSNSNRNYEVFWGGSSEPQALVSGSPAPFDDRRASTAAYINYMRPRCAELARVLNNTGRFYSQFDSCFSRLKISTKLLEGPCNE